MTAEHLSMHPRYNNVSAPPDHPLFLLLADIAARYDVPIDIHMEAVPEEMTLPERFYSPPNPKALQPNITSFERLLDHNSRAKVIWAHAGWNNTGYRTAMLCGELMMKHPNLFMSIRIPPRGVFKRTRSENAVINEYGEIRSEWLKLIRTFPDRFLMGSDEFFLSPRMRRKSHPSGGSTELGLAFLSKLPPGLACKLGYENAKRIFKLGDRQQEGSED